jgi:hypothetical protein
MIDLALIEEVSQLDYQDIPPGLYMCKFGEEDWTCLTFDSDNGWCHQGQTKNFGLDPVRAYGPFD